jgi:hypothetical protein
MAGEFAVDTFFTLSALLIDPKMKILMKILMKNHYH